MRILLEYWTENNTNKYRIFTGELLEKQKLGR
jgi:hypothetical protein